VHSPDCRYFAFDGQAGDDLDEALLEWGICL
jgi:hypothetical protein